MSEPLQQKIESFLTQFPQLGSLETSSTPVAQCVRRWVEALRSRGEPVVLPVRPRGQPWQWYADRLGR